MHTGLLSGHLHSAFLTSHPLRYVCSSQAGKLDLTEVEGLSDLLAAGTQAQHRQALLHATGAVRRRYEGWRARLLTALAAVEVRSRDQDPMSA